MDPLGIASTLSSAKTNASNVHTSARSQLIVKVPSMLISGLTMQNGCPPASTAIRISGPSTMTFCASATSIVVCKVTSIAFVSPGMPIAEPTSTVASVVPEVADGVGVAVGVDVLVAAGVPVAVAVGVGVAVVVGASVAVPVGVAVSVGMSVGVGVGVPVGVSVGV